MARHPRGKQQRSRPSSTDHVASTGGPSSPGAVLPAAVGPAQAAGAEEHEPVIVVYESSERDSKTRLQIVQSGFGSTAAWTAVVDAWRDTSASFALVSAHIFIPLGRAALAALRAALRVPALSPALRPALVRP